MNGRKAPEEEVGVGSFIPSLYHGLLLLLLPLLGLPYLYIYTKRREEEEEREAHS